MRRIAMAATLAISACGPGVHHGAGQVAAGDVGGHKRPYQPGRDVETSSTLPAPAPHTATTRASRSKITGTPAVTYAAQPPQHPVMHLSSTAYCETGRMASGQHTRPMAVAGNRWPLGTTLQVSDGPYGAGHYTVLDTIGHGSDLDFAIPGDCDAARRWGRRPITATVVQP